MPGLQWVNQLRAVTYNGIAMKFSIVLIDFILFLSIFFPYYLFIRIGKSAGKRKINACREVAKSKDLLLSIEESWGNSFIGIDSPKNKLLFIQYNDGRPIAKVICLDLVKDCQILLKYISVKKGKRKEDVLAFLEIQLSSGSSRQATEVLSFYDMEGTAGEDYELDRGEKWLSLIKEHVHHTKPTRLAA
jgi:hypothetical protein